VLLKAAVGRGLIVQGADRGVERPLTLPQPGPERVEQGLRALLEQRE